MKPPPISKKPVTAVNPEDRKIVKHAMRNAQSTSVMQRLLKGLPCFKC